ncbi:hypothetical protein Q3O59_14050 [Alkalimonas delamerensis]|uniref:Uncharacterized protein n=1 Tax=Alkalimonas delamerensis TaxID=265981 RepID=A0ABT9GT63_9GAMM|nr:hypothetical protein [Alkalimonas delamerensis]MDP4530147.1 hypothetical protein [Alkalimonas delamerensis]
MLQPKSLVLINYRRLFPEDDSRFFLGEVEAYQDGIVKVSGHTILRDGVSGTMKEKSDRRTKLFSISSGTLIVYELPANLQLSDLHFQSKGVRLSLTDQASFSMDLTERMT